MAELGRFGVSLTPNEITLTAAVTPQHRSLLSSYRMNQGAESDGRERILADLRNFIDLGAFDRATDLLIVLALWTREASRRERRLALATSRQRDSILLQRGRGMARPSCGRRPPGKKYDALPEGAKQAPNEPCDGDGDDAP